MCRWRLSLRHCFGFVLFLLAFAGIFCELACSCWISVSDDCLLAGGGSHPFFVFFFVITAFGGGSDDLVELELCLDFLVDFLDRELFKHCFAHLQLERSLSAAWQTHALFAQVDFDEQVQHESSCFCVVGGTLIPSPFGLEKSRIDWFVCFTIRPCWRTTCTNGGSVEAEAFFPVFF